MSLLDDVSIVVTPNGYKAGELYAVIPSNGDADMDVTRATAATRVDENGLVNYAEIIGSELVADGSFPTGTSEWGTGTGVTVGSGVATFTSTPSGQSVQQNAVATALPNGSLAKVSFEVLSRTEGSFGLYFSGTLVGSRSSVGVFTAYFTKGTQTSFYIRALGTTSGTISNVSVIEEVRDNVPRIDYTGGGCPHILAEPQRTNLVTYSEDFSDSSWSKSSITVTDGFTSPSGDSTASKLTEGSTNINHQIYNAISGTAGNIYTLSGFFKKGERDIIQLVYGGAAFDEGSVYCNFDLTNGVLGSGTYLDASITLISNGWYRCEFTATKTTTGNFNITYAPKLTSTSSRNAAYTGDGTSGVYIWGAQVEVGSYGTSYIPNFGTALGVTRNQDIFTRLHLKMVQIVV
jgi:hypothetical protein